VISDAQSVVLPNGQFMLGTCCGDYFALFDAGNLSWASFYDQGKLATDTSNGEEGWVLLPSGQVLTVDLWNQNGLGTTSMQYTPGTNSWAAAGNIPVSVADSTCHEMGPLILRRDGTVTAIGGNGQLATYNTSTGAWSAGPLIGGGLGVDDGPGALLPDGNVFFEASPWSQGNATSCANPPPGAVFFEWNGTSLAEEPGPPDEPDDAASTEGRMLVLPTGQVLYDDAYYDNNTDQDKNLYLYTPSGSYLAAWQPRITSVGANVYANTANQPISGAQFNGLSQGSMYGDDEQMAENFPLVYIKNIATGHVFYCRTHDFSTMAVATGSAQVSAEFDVPGNVELGASDVVVVADGIPSNPVQVTVQSGPPPDVTVSPTSIAMRSRNGSTGSGSATLTNNGPGVLRIDSVWVNGDYFSLDSTSCSGGLAENSSCYADVSFSPGSYCIGGTAHGTLYFSDSAGQQSVALSGMQTSCLQIPQHPTAAAAPRAQPPTPPKSSAPSAREGAQ
jgi:hypothetical protein